MLLNSRRFLIALSLLLWVPSLAAQQITGTVIDNSSTAPIEGALVTLQGGSPQVTTAADGSFTMDVNGSGLLLVGAAKGYFYQNVTVNSPASGVVLALDPTPITDNASYNILSPGGCGACHPKQLADWTNTPMARAGFNTWVHDIYDGNGTAGGMGGFVYTRDSIHASTNPNSECASCHQPQHWIENPAAALDPNTSSPTPAVEFGVSCDICHKVADVDESRINYPGIFPGAVTYNRPDPGTQIQYGVLGDVDFLVPPLMRASYQPQLRAEVCAACHQDAADPDQNETFNGVISEPTYLEWLASPYAVPRSSFYADCVDCHMGPSGDNGVCNNITPPNRPVEAVRDHEILGTTAAYLENAVDMTLEVYPYGSQLRVSVTVANNQTGHHVPTGVTVRNMILVVEAWEDGQDPLTNPLPYTGVQTIHDLGGIGDPAQGYYAGLPGEFYSKVNHDSNGNGPTFFTDATGILFDNRIPALEADTTNYTFALPEDPTTLHVRARLIYRRAFRFLVDAKGWDQDGHGNPLADVAPPHYGHLMEMEEDTLVAGVAVIPTMGTRALVLMALLLAAAAVLGIVRR